MNFEKTVNRTPRIIHGPITQLSNPPLTSGPRLSTSPSSERTAENNAGTLEQRQGQAEQAKGLR